MMFKFSSNQQLTINNQQSYTLVEILVVVSIIFILLLLALPGIRAMQSGSAEANAYNIINAALQAARSYAIMNGVKTAARFQPNGKIFLVYRFEGNSSSQADDWAVANPPAPYPNPATNSPNSDGYIYLPVIAQEPLRLPTRYAVADPNKLGEFEEPFYICYSSDGTLAIGEDIFVALIDDETAPTPVNPDFDGDGKFAWDNWPLGGSYGLSNWIDYTQNDAADIDDINDRKLARYYYIAQNASDLETILEDQDIGPDHYAGANFGTPTLHVNSVSQIAIFKTPDRWNELPIYASSGKYKSDIVANEIPANEFETIYINPYTGRIIRPVK